MSAPEDRRIGDELDWLERLIRRARAGAAELRDGDIRFIDTLVLAVDRYGAATFISPAQRKWLDDIAKRLDQAGVPADPGSEPVPDRVPGSGTGDAMR